MPYSIEKTGEWAGVTLPSWLRAFDCRSGDDEIAPRAPWGESLWSSERAMVDMGLKLGYGDTYATTPLSGSGYCDMRTAPDAEIARTVRRMIAAAREIRQEYERAHANPAAPDAGGGVYYMPVAIALGNFGWSVIADTRTRVVS